MTCYCIIIVNWFTSFRAAATNTRMFSLLHTVLSSSIADRFLLNYSLFHLPFPFFLLLSFRLQDPWHFTSTEKGQL